MENVHPNYEKRMQLLQDTLNCRKTDRVMAAPFYTYLPILLYGETTIKDAIADWRNALPSSYRYHEEFQPDLSYGPSALFPGKPTPRPSFFSGLPRAREFFRNFANDTCRGNTSPVIV